MSERNMAESDEYQVSGLESLENVAARRSAFIVDGNPGQERVAHAEHQLSVLARHA